MCNFFHGYETKLWTALYDDSGRSRRKNKRAKIMFRQEGVMLGCLASKSLICGRI